MEEKNITNPEQKRSAEIEEALKIEQIMEEFQEKPDFSREKSVAAKKVTAKKMAMNQKKVIFFAAVCVLVVVFAVSAFMVVSHMMEGKRQENLYAQYEKPTAPSTAPTVPQETAPQATEEKTTEPTVETEPTEPQILEEMMQYYNDNPHTVGFISIPGTELAYPVLQTPENRDYYLKRDFWGKSSEYGAIYAELADINRPSDNITMYGHNMKNGSMFGLLHKYQNKTYWEEHPIISFNTLYEYHDYEIFAVFKTDADEGKGWDYHHFIDAESEDEFNQFVHVAKYGRPKELGEVVAFYDTGITPTYGDKLITLSTCEYTMGTSRNGRLVVCARRIT